MKWARNEVDDVEPKVLRPVLQNYPDNPDFHFWCPGCKCGHSVYTTKKNSRNAQWVFVNGNMEKPTFTPSFLHDLSKPRCHLVMTDGMLNFCGDCEHELAGKSVPMEPF